MDTKVESQSNDKMRNIARGVGKARVVALITTLHLIRSTSLILSTLVFTCRSRRSMAYEMSITNRKLTLVRVHAYAVEPA